MSDKTVGQNYTLVCSVCQRVIYLTRRRKNHVRPVKWSLCSLHRPQGTWSQRKMPCDDKGNIIIEQKKRSSRNG